jgi:hypothetical protein
METPSDAQKYFRVRQWRACCGKLGLLEWYGLGCAGLSAGKPAKPRFFHRPPSTAQSSAAHRERKSPVDAAEITYGEWKS